MIDLNQIKYEENIEKAKYAKLKQKNTKEKRIILKQAIGTIKLILNFHWQKVLQEEFNTLAIWKKRLKRKIMLIKNFTKQEKSIENSPTLNLNNLIENKHIISAKQNLLNITIDLASNI